jgi:hypothetical protein
MMKKSACFIGWQKAFDHVNWTKLMQVLKETGINWCKRRFINKLYKQNEALHTVKKERNILHTIKGGKANCMGHILHRKCLLKHITEGKVEGRIQVTER